MTQLLLPKRKAIAISNGVFLISLGLLFFTNFWWPGILLALWATLGTRQYLSGRNFDLIITSVILLGLFVVALLPFDVNVLLPVLFVIGGIYIIFREYYFGEDSNGEEKSQEIKDDADINNE